MEVSGLVGDPSQKTLDVFSRPQRVKGRVALRKIMIGDMSVDGPVADRMKRHRLRSALALWHCMVPFHPQTKWATTQCARQLICLRWSRGLRLHLLQRTHSLDPARHRFCLDASYNPSQSNAGRAFFVPGRHGA